MAAEQKACNPSTPKLGQQDPELEASLGYRRNCLKRNREARRKEGGERCREISAVKIKAASVFSSFKQASRPEKHGWLNNTRCFPQIYFIRYFKHLKNTFIQNHDLDNNAQHISDLYAKKKSVDTCMS